MHGLEMNFQTKHMRPTQGIMANRTLRTAGVLQATFVILHFYFKPNLIYRAIINNLGDKILSYLHGWYIIINVANENLMSFLAVFKLLPVCICNRFENTPFLPTQMIYNSPYIGLLYVR
jgi:hypothetical protein